MNLYRDFAKRNYVRPVILELGGKNPAIVSRNANLEDAATGIVNPMVFIFVLLKLKTEYPCLRRNMEISGNVME
jgi:hypothetical protein